MSTAASNAAPTGTTSAAPSTAATTGTTAAATTTGNAAVGAALDTAAVGAGLLAIIGMLLAFLFAFLFSFGAAKLSYDTYGNILWAILDFFFASVYYPFYALVLHQAPAPTGMLGMGRRRKH